MTLAITPETKVGALLEAYPEIEETLIACTPAFAKLRNPILRKTVGKVATIEQAARIGGVALPELVRKLRAAAGRSPLEVVNAALCASAEGGGEWLQQARIVEEIDVDAMLERSVHPVGRVRELAAKLQPGEAIRLLSSFRPEPLIETMRRSGCAATCRKISDTRYATWFGRE